MSDSRMSWRWIITIEAAVILVSLLASALFSSQFSAWGDAIIDRVKGCGAAFDEARLIADSRDQGRFSEYLQLMDSASQCDTRTGAAAASTLAAFYCSSQNQNAFDRQLGAQYKQLVERASRSTYIDQRLVYEACGGTLQ